VQNSEYTINLRIEGLDEKKRSKLIKEINGELGVSFKENTKREELHDVSTVVTFFSAGVTSIGILLQLYRFLRECNQEENVEIDVKHDGEGEIYIIDSEEVNLIEGSVSGSDGENAVVNLTTEEVLELQRERENNERN
jgi:hypothetical protein